MGERVYVSAGEPRVNPPPPPPGAQPAEPLNYADRSVSSPFEQWVRGFVIRLGGWPQIIFAGGLGLIAGSVAFRGYGLWAFAGGVMVGLVLRVPLRRDW